MYVNTGCPVGCRTWISPDRCIAIRRTNLIGSRPRPGTYSVLLFYVFALSSCCSLTLCMRAEQSLSKKKNQKSTFHRKDKEFPRFLTSGNARSLRSVLYAAHILKCFSPERATSALLINALSFGRSGSGNSGLIQGRPSRLACGRRRPAVGPTSSLFGFARFRRIAFTRRPVNSFVFF